MPPLGHIRIGQNIGDRLVPAQINQLHHGNYPGKLANTLFGSPAGGRRRKALPPAFSLRRHKKKPPGGGSKKIELNALGVCGAI